MNLPITEQLIDCVSAKDLLKALNTLQQISTDAANQLELSFSKSSHSLFNTVDNKSHMDFSMYMQLKNNINKKQNPKFNKKPQPKQSKPQQKGVLTSKRIPADNQISHKSTTPRKQSSKTPTRPLRQVPKNINISAIVQRQTSIKHAKSRSHSPINSHSHHKSAYYVSKKQNMQLQVSINMHSATRKSVKDSQDSKVGKNNKENRQNMCESKQSNVKFLNHSKKLMIQRQKKGKAYVPIHQRTNQLIREKQQKIAKLQRASLAQQQIEQRECTFKPSINSKKPQTKQKGHHIRASTTVDENIQNHSQICITNFEPLCSSIGMSNVNMNTSTNTKREKSELANESKVKENGQIQQQTLRKDRKRNNQKFQILLDFI